MIVNYKEEGWQIITQRAHGLLAGQLCYNWKNRDYPERWLETIIAAAEHDDVFNEFEQGEILLNENGGPVNFKMRKFEEHKCDDLLHLAATKSTYIALLTSRHLQFLHEKSEDKGARNYCRNLKMQDKIWQKQSGIGEVELRKAYALVEWCDAFSLLICQGLVQPENRKIEIGNGPDDQCYQLHEIKDNILTVEPWPFDSDRFKIHYESRTIKQLGFKNEKEFREILMKTPPDIHQYQVSR